MLRILVFLSMSLLLSLMTSAQARADGAEARADIPESIEGCLKTGLTGLLGINRADQQSLFEYFLANIDMEKFGNYKWSEVDQVERGKHKGDTTSFDARLADRPAVRGEGIYHIVARVNFAAGSSTTIVVFSSGCRVFGFMYGGANLRSFVNADVVERYYRSGKRAPF